MQGARPYTNRPASSLEVRETSLTSLSRKVAHVIIFYAKIPLHPNRLDSCRTLVTTEQITSVNRNSARQTNTVPVMTACKLSISQTISLMLLVRHTNILGICDFDLKTTQCSAFAEILKVILLHRKHKPLLLTVFGKP